MRFLKGYKKLYEIEKEKNSELRKENDDLREKAEKEITPFSLKVYFNVEDVEGNKNYIIFENADREYMTVEMYPIGSAVDKMYGINVVQLTKKETKELLEGKFLYISDGEYATCIRAGEIAKAFEKAREGGGKNDLSKNRN